MKLSTSLNIFDKSIPIETAIERCKASGFTALDFNYWDYQKSLLEKTWAEEEAWAQEIRNAAELNGVQFTQMHGPSHGKMFHEMRMGLDELSFNKLCERSIRTAAILGVPWVVFHPGLIPKDSNMIEHRKGLLNKNIAMFSKLLPLMEEQRVGIAFENLKDNINSEIYRRYYGAVPEELIELVDGFDHPLVGACWDTGHGHVQGNDQGESIRALGNRLKATHIQDNNGQIDQHLLPFHGTIDWSAVINALHDIDYQGDFTYEVHNAIYPLPDELRDAALRYAHQVGRYISKTIKP